MKLNEQMTGFTLGLFVGGVHLVWSVLIALGFAQTLINWSFSWHMLSNPFIVQPFSLTNAVILVVATGLVGYAIGYAFAKVWNQVHK